ncbi:MAG: hypothetical protein ACMG6E_04560 [Candidatus Roizmanbacteria bacterium]
MERQVRKESGPVLRMLSSLIFGFIEAVLGKDNAMSRFFKK